MNRYLSIFTAGFLILIILGCGRNDVDTNRVLVSTAWLEEQLDNPALVILHTGTEDVYDSIHIPGARLVDPYEFTKYKDSLRNEMPELAVLDSLLTSLGITEDSNLLLYYEDEDFAGRTARVFVTLDYVGLGSRTSVLNGGLTAWTDEGRSTTDRASQFSTGDISLVERQGVIAYADDVNHHRTDPDYVIGDARSFEEYMGEIDSTDHTVSGGHVHGSVHLPYVSLFSETKTHMIKDDETLLGDFHEQGVDGSETLIYYCGSGIRASVSYLVSRHLGFKPMLYDGSIEDWDRRKYPVIQPVYDNRDHD